MTNCSICGSQIEGKGQCISLKYKGKPTCQDCWCMKAGDFVDTHPIGFGDD